MEIDKTNITGKYILIGQTPVPEPDLMKWAMWYEQSGDARIVKQTEFGGIKVSTVFLALDHALSPYPHEPVLFETMIFGGESDGYQERCCTWAEAEDQHFRVIEMVIGRSAV